jgi:organic hydroperoxide reductase OsmC/OhrA
MSCHRRVTYSTARCNPRVTHRRLCRYESRLRWSGSTATGYETYDREHRVVVPPATTELRLSSDAAFHGNPALPNPEQLLGAAASSCQLLMFLAMAARSRVEVLAYEGDAAAVMPEDATPMRITQITLRPRILVAPGANLDRVRRLVDRAHDGWYIANTVNAEIVVKPTIEHAADSHKDPFRGR